MTITDANGDPTSAYASIGPRKCLKCGKTDWVSTEDGLCAKCHFGKVGKVKKPRKCPVCDFTSATGWVECLVCGTKFECPRCKARGQHIVGVRCLG